MRTDERRIEPRGRPRRDERWRRGGRGLCLAIGLVGAAIVLAACSSAPKATPSAALPTIPSDLSLPPDLSLAPGDSLPPDESLPPDQSLSPNESFPPDASFPTDFLRHGTATISITSGEPMTIRLAHIAGDGPSMMDPDLGVDVTWRGGDWALHVQGGDMLDPTAIGDSGLTLIREDTDTPLQADGSNCTITYTVETPTHVAGHAECTGLQWMDAFDGYTTDSPAPSDSSAPVSGAPTSPAPGSPAIDRPPFNATITFDATP